ncbi:MAG: (2Fe-2S)-binding protein [Rhodocyclaceae bacterium]|jgi:carbon-monoxide dehydrogenase small subunit|nr:(2Fe-2S)-binding protein [Rhodocyclaceae bacterium]MCE2980559.1 (2Fe-2S)-binding protein [Betaproteobacteria bacterium]MCA3075090.1 (2Fe-2S)-binding protein [Rhodocyclaceae bacterium]MCA3091233.1 (2Fe-2S)-binding protein [Rhodocyclaceae bacterium]MCA3095308.1 (2Fe-2S)-binding protein [Rhodocyclaceae bacterium]
MASKMAITLDVNGTEHEIRVEPRKTLSDALRGDCGLTGTNVGCEHGVCGACTVLMDGAPVRSCLMFAVQAQGRKLRTVEGLAASSKDGGKLHALQQAFIDNHALQCGFCTSGFLMLAAGTLEQQPDIDDASLREVLSSNLCRCTGYQNILRAVRQVRDAGNGGAR